jgi:hypothetical protein
VQLVRFSEKNQIVFWGFFFEELKWSFKKISGSNRGNNLLFRSSLFFLCVVVVVVILFFFWKFIHVYRVRVCMNVC